MTHDGGDDQNVLQEAARLLLDTKENVTKLAILLGKENPELLKALLKERGKKVTEVQVTSRQSAPADETASMPEDRIYRCSFCDKNEYDVEKVFARQDVCICDECVVLCMDILRSPEDDI